MDLPYLCERIIEVPVRDWLVAAALQKDGAFCSRKPPLMEDHLTDEGDAPDETDKGGSRRVPTIFAVISNNFKLSCVFFLNKIEETVSGSQPAFGSIPYIARPHPEQKGHTGEGKRLSLIPVKFISL